MAKDTLVYGTSGNGIPYLEFGHGPKTMLFLAGGPGNLVPRGFGASGFLRGMRPFADEYTIRLVTRKSGLPEGYTMRRMSDDYGELIRAELGGRVDLVLGVSFGGMIALYLAADHPDAFGHIAVAMAAYKVTNEAKEMDLRYARLISQRKDREAMASRADAMFTGVARPLVGGLLWAFGKPLLGKIDDTFRRDVVIEAEAEMDFDATDVLPRINVPVLLVGGRDDFAFPLSYMEETAALIPKAQLKIYEGGHTAAFMDKRFVEDVREFTSRAPEAE